MVLNYIERRSSRVKSRAAFRQEIEQQAAHPGRLLLLHPVTRAVDKVAAEQLRAGPRLHRLEHAGTLIGAPILLARDEAGGDVDGAAGQQLELAVECA